MTCLEGQKNGSQRRWKKKVDKWKFSSGALVMCLVAYSDGQDVQAFQLVFISYLMICLSPDSQC